MRWSAGLAVVLILVTGAIARAQTVEVAPGVHVSKKVYEGVPVNEQPFFGFAQKPPRLIEADDKFIAQASKEAGTRETATARYVDYGFTAFRSSHHDIAGRRFNQAFLLDPSAAGVYHGFAVLTHVRFKDPAYAEELFKIAIARPGAAPTVGADYGRFLLIERRPQEARAVYETVVVDMPDNALVWHMLAVSRLQAGDHAAACQAVEEAARRPDAVSADLDRVKGAAQCK